MVASYALMILLGGGLAVSPEGDPATGATVSASDRRLAPSGRSNASLLDLWFADTSLLLPSGGGLNMLDPPRVSARGWSATDTTWSVLGHDITDPARPGLPLIDVPLGFVRQSHWQALNIAAPNFDSDLQLQAPALMEHARLGGEVPLGGSTWVPKHFMDREPALEWGATSTRRQLYRGYEAELSARGPLGVVAVEHVGQRRRYPTLTDVSGALIDDEANRTTVLAGGEQIGNLPARWTLLWQHRNDNHAGAEARYPENQTLAATQNALAATFDLPLVQNADWAVALGLSGGYAQEHREALSNEPYLYDLVGEWKMLTRPLWPGASRRGRVDLNLVAKTGSATPCVFKLDLSRADLSETLSVPGDVLGTTYQDAATLEQSRVYLTTVTQAQAAREQLYHGRLSFDVGHTWEWARLNGVAALDYSYVGVARGPDLEQLDPALGLLASGPLGPVSWFAFVRHEPLANTAQVSAFLDHERATLRRADWHDDGDGVPETNEAAQLRAVTGGDTTHVGANLKRPTSEQLAVGLKAPFFGPFHFVFSGLAHAMRHRYQVELSGAAAASYRATTVGAVENSPTGDQALRAYERTAGTEGQERYRLVNGKRDSRYLGAELQLMSDPDRPWFVSLGGAAYWSLSNAAFGVYPDRNDPGIIDLDSADPNHQVNRWGSPDGARAYHAKLAAGATLWDDLTGGLVVRYTDGEPMTRFRVVELSQGPTVLMAESRGNPIPRFTFHMTVDVRLRYSLTLANGQAALVADLYNLLGSGTEVLEDLSTPRYRRSVEMMPGRALYLGIEGDI